MGREKAIQTEAELFWKTASDLGRLDYEVFSQERREMRLVNGVRSSEDLETIVRSLELILRAIESFIGF